MKKLSTILYLFFGCLVGLFAFLFIVIEGRMLFAGDWLLYDSVFVGYLQVLSKFVLALFSLAVVICSFIFKKKCSLYIECAGIVVICTVVCVAEFGIISICLFALSLVYLFSALFFHAKHFIKK